MRSNRQRRAANRRRIALENEVVICDLSLQRTLQTPQGLQTRSVCSTPLLDRTVGASRAS
jgi:hypothetical protein